MLFGKGPRSELAIVICLMALTLFCLGLGLLVFHMTAS